MKDEIQKSKRIVEYEYSQLWIGVLGTVFVFLVVYVFEVPNKHEPGKKPVEFLALWGAMMFYKLLRYRRHKKKIEKNLTVEVR